MGPPLIVNWWVLYVSPTPSALVQLIMHEPELVMMVREISPRRPVGKLFEAV